MWRHLNNDEKNAVLVNYKIVAYLVRGVMGLWLVFSTFFYIMALKEVIRCLINKNYFDGVGIILGLLFFCGFGFLLPIYFIKNEGIHEIRAINNNDVWIREVCFVCASWEYRRDNSRKYFATVQWVDEVGGAVQTVECRSLKNMKGKYNEGDIVSLLRIDTEKGSKYVCFGGKDFKSISP